MFWFKKTYSTLILIAALTACKSADQAPDIKNTYFDIRGFFTSEASRLSASKPMVAKMITDDSTSEKKNIRIANWQNELALFSASDINKPSWRDSYGVTQEANITTYTALEEGLRTRLISIKKNTSGKTVLIRIHNKTSNLLYSSEESLEYFPDSLYRIEKYQDIKLLGAHRYVIEAKFR